MHIIPVIDVRFGIAVRAVAGDRENYQPLVTPLTKVASPSEWGQTHGSDPSVSGAPSSDLVAVARGYCSVYPFSTLYIADLDGIEGREASTALATEFAAQLPGVNVWIDAGLRPAAAGKYVTPVIGSESINDEVAGRKLAENIVLSLDFRGDSFIGPPALLARPDLWPARVIVMTLGRVGTHHGPDLDRIAEIARLAPSAKVYAAGGIRDVADLRAARAAGAHGALIASALHSQKIKADDLREITGL